MTALSCMIARFPGITAFCFIDDSYRVAALDSLRGLQHAVGAIALFDQLVGQKLKLEKSPSFGTSKPAQCAIAEAFPNIPVELVVNVPGTSFRNAKTNKANDAAPTLHVVECVHGAIATLPLSITQKAHLIAAKAHAKLRYAADLNPLAKATFDPLNALVARALWGNRPSWRQVDILLGIVNDACLVHPQIAHATAVLMSLVTICRKDLDFAVKFLPLLSNDPELWLG